MAKGVTVIIICMEEDGIASLSLQEQEFLIAHLQFWVISVVHMPLDGSKEAILEKLAKLCQDVFVLVMLDGNVMADLYK